MSTNDKKDESDKKPDDKGEVSDDDLKKLKDNLTEVESDEKSEDESEKKEEAKETEKEAEGEEKKDAAEEETESEEEKPEEKEEAKESFERKFKQFKGDTPEEYAQNLETAYENSTSEALKWKKIAEDLQSKEPDDQKIDPGILYARQRMAEDIDKDIDDFGKDYPQLFDPVEHDKLQKKVGVLARAIREAENRQPSMKEVLELAAATLGWEKGSKGDDVAAAVKDGAATSKTSSKTKSSKKGAEITDAQMAAAKALFPDAKESELRKDLAAYV